MLVNREEYRQKIYETKVELNMDRVMRILARNEPKFDNF